MSAPATSSDPIPYWNGPAGARWVAAQEDLDRMMAPFADAVLARARPAAGERVIDVGCGCGATTLAAAAAVGPGGAVVGVDVSAPMLARARERAALGGLAAVTFVEADATTHRPAAPADLIVSRFGVMFFVDPEAAFANLFAMLRPGGRIAFACWRALGENPWASVPYAAAQAALGNAGDSLGGTGPGPFALADGARVRRLLEGAGFEGVTLEPVDHPMVMGEGLDEAVAFAFCGGPAARLLAGADEAGRARAAAALREALAPYAATGRVALGGAVWIAGARREG